MLVKKIDEIAKSYDPSIVEDKWYKYWEENDLYHSEINTDKESYSIVIPPPNVTGMLHMGHILNNTVQDIYIRYKRMKGFNACWVPGTDHASIATETKVVKYLKDLNIDKDSLSAEEFLKYCWEWTEKYGGIIISQLRKLGVSCDWKRQRFTMDEHYYKRVQATFVDLYKKGYIYKGYRMVNWCPATKSAISDEEVLYKEVQGNLWYLRYPISGTGDYLVVATTRPETMLGDTGVAVNPEDERYCKFIGKKVKLPLTGREIPIFGDDYVEKTFGTGVVKVTPAHDVNDYAMYQRHDLEIINIFNEDATTNNNVPEEFRNKDRYEVRKLVIKKLEEEGFLEKIEQYTNKVGYSERGGVPVEPFLSEQWFMKMEELAKPAIEVVNSGEIRFHPERWVKTYNHWMNNIKDWCISRQLQWGHKIPVWYNNETNELYCDIIPPKDLENWTQEKDVLDTWASSWLWAFEVFETEEEKQYYYPTDLLVTAPDIIFFWVARMIIAGMEYRQNIPFKDVYFTSVIRDEKGRKMSKSLGNSPDPLDVIRDYGADALRFTITYIAPLGQDVMFSVDKCDFGRNFSNKIWNASRFLLMNSQEVDFSDCSLLHNRDILDEWLDSRHANVIREYEKSLDKFEITGAAKILYSYVWNDYCDWYLEMLKSKIYGNDENVKKNALYRSIIRLEEILKMLHPFMPFITEEIWQYLDKRNSGESISVSEFPEFDESKINIEIDEKFELIKNIVGAVRNLRGELNISPSKQLEIIVKGENKFENEMDYIKLLTKAKSIIIDSKFEKKKLMSSSVIKGYEIYIDLEGLIDIDAEKDRILKEINRLEGMLMGVNKKLQNSKFADNAPEDVVLKERQKKQDWEEKITKLRITLNSFEKSENERIN